MKIFATSSFYFFINKWKTSFCLPPDVHNLPNDTQSDQENGSRKLTLISENVRDFAKKYGLSIITKEEKIMEFSHDTQKLNDLKKEIERRKQLLKSHFLPWHERVSETDDHDWPIILIGFAMLFIICVFLVWFGYHYKKRQTLLPNNELNSRTYR